MDLPPWQEPGWRGRLLQRTLYEAGTHLVDYAISLFGERPLAIQATTSTCGVREGSTDAERWSPSSSRVAVWPR
jgi:hypothetical protein